jgi:hypothetical protein
VTARRYSAQADGGPSCERPAGRSRRSPLAGTAPPLRPGKRRSGASAPPQTGQLSGGASATPMRVHRDSPHAVHLHPCIPTVVIPTGALGQTGISLRSMADEDPTTETLRLEQLERERAERERAEQAPTRGEERAADRRADKAAYLREKLEEQAEHPDDPA